MSPLWWAATVFLAVGVGLGCSGRWQKTMWPAGVYLVGIALVDWNLVVDNPEMGTDFWLAFVLLTLLGLFYVWSCWSLYRHARRCHICHPPKEKRHGVRTEHQGQVDGGAPEEAGDGAQ